MLGVRQDQRSRALSSRTIVVWSVGLAVVAAAAMALLWIFLGTGSPADARRLDAIRTAASLVIGAGGAAALLLAARRQRYVELDLEQKEHDANERRVTELYGKAADQLGSDKAPVRLAGVYALERLAQDHPQHRQTIVNLLCAYLRMPYAPPREPTPEQLVRGAVQDVFESHLQPAAPDRFWPDIDLTLTGAVLEYFWFRNCQARDGNFRYVTFHEIAAFRDSTFTGRADFHRCVFTDKADLRRTAFGPGRTLFTDTTFGGNVDFGAEPAESRTVILTGATAKTTATRTWPTGWTDKPDPDDEDQVRTVET
jgi:hypothetical protein